MRSTSRHFIFTATALCLVSVVLLTGCFGKKEGDSRAAVPVAVQQAPTNVEPGSVIVTRMADDQVKVNWKTKTPVAGGVVLGATLHFERRPLYSLTAREVAASPTIDHEAIIKGVKAEGELSVGIAYGQNELTDNGGYGFKAGE